MVHSFEDFSPWLVGPVALGLWEDGVSWQRYVVEETALLMARNQEEEETGAPFTGIPSMP